MNAPGTNTNDALQLRTQFLSPAMILNLRRLLVQPLEEEQDCRTRRATLLEKLAEKHPAVPELKASNADWLATDNDASRVLSGLHHAWLTSGWWQPAELQELLDRLDQPDADSDTTAWLTGMLDRPLPSPIATNTGARDRTPWVQDVVQMQDGWHTATRQSSRLYCEGPPDPYSPDRWIDEDAYFKASGRIDAVYTAIAAAAYKALADLRAAGDRTPPGQLKDDLKAALKAVLMKSGLKS
ncbi:hypothetical protein OHV05_36690 (plasmid) [Kitasatospora sp. NBC_00070]|uniref:hypothetical protein n=1 Tax=Kitasatospora sp. NBC_00070 TaxID=2975962 RepID=UPI002F90D3E4